MKIVIKDLRKAISDVLLALDASEKEASLVADVLIEADLRGIPTHGCAFIPLIAERYANKVINIPTKLDFVNDDGAITHIEGNNGFGQVAAAEAMQQCIDKAKQNGIGFSLVRNTNHIGFLCYYPLMAVAEGMVGISMTNAAPAMAPFGGAEAFFGTNPLSIASPVAKGHPFVLDMSTSVVARGKIRRAQRENQSIGDGWALDADGLPTNDPNAALAGTVLPIAGPKGYGLSLFIDLLSGLLSGSKYGKDLLTFHKPLGPTGVGATFIAIDIKRFMPLEQFNTLAHDYAESIRNMKKAKGVEQIYLPGEIEAIRAESSRKEGLVEVDDQIIDKINLILKEKGLSLHLKEEN